MPVTVRKRGNKWVVTDGNRVFGTHSTKKEAIAQVGAIGTKSSETTSSKKRRKK